MNDCPRQNALDMTWLRLVAAYGYPRAAAIMNGKDPATNADIAAWRDLGKPKPPKPEAVALETYWVAKSEAAKRRWSNPENRAKHAEILRASYARRHPPEKP